jgi:endo-1,3-1,4-beta-glycanase ExoK
MTVDQFLDGLDHVLANIAQAISEAAGKFAGGAKSLSEKVSASASGIRQRFAAKASVVLQPVIVQAQRISPEKAGVIAGLAAVVLVTISSTVYAGIASARKADTARAVAAGEIQPKKPVTPPPAPEPAPVAPAPAAPVAEPQVALKQMGKAFIERFDSEDFGDAWYVSDGWSNGAWMENDWRRSQLSATPEGLRITLAALPKGSEKPFTSGEIRTTQKFRYGYFEVSMRVPKDPGLVAGVFTYAERKDGVVPNEIDIEILGRRTHLLELTYHQNSKATSSKAALPFDAADGFHSYAFDWRPDAVRWYADGVMIHEETGPGVRKLTRPQSFYLNFWASRQLHSWVGELDARKAPWAMDVACVAYAPVYEGKMLCR